MEGAAEQIVSVSILGINQDEVTVSVTTLTGANKSVAQICRMRTGGRINVSYGIQLKGDMVREIPPSTRNMLTRIFEK